MDRPKPTNDSISLREYVDGRFEAQEKAVAAALAAAKSAVDAALAAAQKAVDKAEAASEKRFESVNEFRAALSDASRLNMPRTEAEQQIRTLNDKIEVVSARLAAREERGEGKGQVWSLIGAVVAVIASLVAIVVALRPVAL